jgi:hypothetical protein
MASKPSIRNLSSTLDDVARLSKELAGNKDTTAQAFVAATASVRGTLDGLKDSFKGLSPAAQATGRNHNQERSAWEDKAAETLVGALKAARDSISALKQADPNGRLYAVGGALRVNALTLDADVSIVLEKERVGSARDAGFNIQDPFDARTPTPHAQAQGSGLRPKPAGRGQATGARTGR